MNTDGHRYKKGSRKGVKARRNFGDLGVGMIFIGLMNYSEMGITRGNIKIKATKEMAGNTCITWSYSRIENSERYIYLMKSETIINDNGKNQVCQ